MVAAMVRAPGKIQVIAVTDSMGGDALAGTPYAGSQTVQGTSADAFRIASELFEHGLNVIVRRHDGGILVYADRRAFQIRC